MSILQALKIYTLYFLIFRQWQILQTSSPSLDCLLTLRVIFYSIKKLFNVIKCISLFLCIVFAFSVLFQVHRSFFLPMRSESIYRTSKPGGVREKPPGAPRRAPPSGISFALERDPRGRGREWLEGRSGPAGRRGNWGGGGEDRLWGLPGGDSGP